MLWEDANGPVLWSVAYPVCWEGPTLTADLRPTSVTPNGIYAQKVLEPSYRTLPVWGVVALSGIVVEGTNGYRAERATIRSLKLRGLPETTPIFRGMPMVWRHKPWDVAEQLAARYQCDVELDWLPRSTLPAEELTA